MPYLGNAPFEGTISSNSIADGSITTSKIQDTAVTGLKLETVSGLTGGSYGTASAIPQITIDSKGRITAISTNSVSIPSDSISVTGGDITLSGITGTAITNATIVNSAVTTAKIADAAVTTAKIANAAVTSAKLDTNISIAGSLTVGGSQLGSSGLSVNGTTDNDDSQIAIKKPNQSAFSLLAWDGSIFIGYNNYFSNGAWVHSAPTGINVQSLLVISGDGVYTYASSNSGSSWNIANGVKLWDLDGTWRGPLNSGAGTINGALTVTGNLTVNGTTTTVNSTTVTIDDPIFTLGGDAAPSVDDSKDRGIEFRWHNGTTAKVGFFGFDRSSQKLMFIPDASNTSEVFSGSLGIIDVSAVHINGSAMTTSNIGEGTNLYYTDARARASVSFSAGSGGYNSSTGVITIPTNTNQLTNGAGFANTGKAIAMALVFGG
jgi:hypothetical protein